MTNCRPVHDLQEWFKSRPSSAKGGLLAVLILAMLVSCKAAVEPTAEYSGPTQAAQSPTVVSGSPSATPPPAPQATATVPPAPSIPSIYGAVFHDWNGNGKQDSVEAVGEPALPGVRVCLDDPGSGLCAVSDDSGQYLIEEVPPGDHNLLIDAERYPHLLPSIDTAVALETEEVPVEVDGRTLVNIGLGEGPLTLPFLCAEMGQVVGISANFDQDRRPGLVRDWMGGSQSEDGYEATIFELRGAVQVVASAPGVVTYIGTYLGRYVIEVRCDATVPWFPSSRTLWLFYYGLEELSVERGDTIARGQMLGRITETGSEGGSVLKHLTLRAKRTDSYGSYVFVDLFRDTQKVESWGLWTRDNDPACFPGP